MKVSADETINIFLRSAEYDDLDLLFKWANDPVVRASSFNTDPIPYESHVKWFKEMMEDATVLQYILMDDDTPIGQIRLDTYGDKAEIGYSIESEHRSKGYGHKILQLVVGEIKMNHPEIKTLISKVKADNTASNKLFISEGYGLYYSCYIQKI